MKCRCNCNLQRVNTGKTLIFSTMFFKKTKIMIITLKRNGKSLQSFTFGIVSFPSAPLPNFMNKIPPTK